MALTIAGSDSAAGAGIQADLKTMAALGVLATTVLTTVTAQNTVSVSGVHVVPTEFVEQQIDAVLDDLPVRAVKTGVLASTSTVELVARFASESRLPNLVVDPVFVASTGRRLLDEDGLDAYRRLLAPLALVLTPNLPEAAALTGIEASALRDVEGMVRAAEVLTEAGTSWVLVKGGHLPAPASADRSRPVIGPADPERMVPDVLYDGHTVTMLEQTWINTANTHGTGCTLSAALCAGLARGLSVPDAARAAKVYVTTSLEGAAAWRIGKGRSPLDHFGWSRGS